MSRRKGTVIRGQALDGEGLRPMVLEIDGDGMIVRVEEAERTKEEREGKRGEKRRREAGRADRAREGSICSPGFLDLHVHGAMGCDVVGADEEGLEAFGSWLLRSGVTAFVATLHAAPTERLRSSAERLKTVFAREDMPCLLGLHFEGPFLSPERPGALPAEAFALPSGASCAELLEIAAGLACIMTVAPERPGALELIARLSEHGALAAFGHSAADGDCTKSAIEAGLRHVTHLFNAMPGLHHRRPGPIPSLLLDDRITVELICDGHHVHPDMVRLVHRSVGPRRLCLVSDATAGAGLSDGPLPWAGRQLMVAGGAARLSDGTLAGSTLGLDLAIRNLHAWGIPTNEALAAASLVPRQVLGKPFGGFTVGSPLDCVLLDEALHPRETWVRGRRLWTAEGR